MINKILSISTNKTLETIHPDGERKKQNSNNNHDQPNNSLDLKDNLESIEAQNEQNTELSLNYSKNELIIWIKELNNFDWYQSINLNFLMDESDKKIVVQLKDKKGHILQEYLPLQIKILHSQLKKDLKKIPKGTILNISC